MVEVACMLKLQPAFVIKSHFGFLYSSGFGKGGFVWNLTDLFFETKPNLCF